MLKRCTETFETREDGWGRSIEAGTVWQVTRMDIADGGYELAVITRVEDGEYREEALVRLDRLTTNFETIPRDAIAYPTLSFGQAEES